VHTLQRLASLFETFNGRFAIFVSFFVVAIMSILVIEVVARYVFDSPTVWADQLSILIFGGFFIMGGAYTMLGDGHVRMDLIYRRLPSDQVRAVVDVVTSSLFFLFCGVLLFKTVPYCWQAMLNGDRVTALAWPAIIWPTYWCLPVATFLLLIEGIIKTARSLRIAVSSGGQS
jgi:TRAP-type mannitol/chloroaromatic compound transport system permease small subunit